MTMCFFSLACDEHLNPTKYSLRSKTPNKAMTGQFNMTYTNIGLNIFLSIISFGLFGIFWLVNLIKSVHAVNGENKSVVVEVLLCLFLPYYTAYWFYKAGRSLANTDTIDGQKLSDNSTIYIILTIFGFGIVAYAILQFDLNKLALG